MIFLVTRRPPHARTRARRGKVRPFAPRTAAAPAGTRRHAHAHRRATLTQDRADAPSGASASRGARVPTIAAGKRPPLRLPAPSRAQGEARAGFGPGAARAERAFPPQNNGGGSDGPCRRSPPARAADLHVPACRRTWTAGRLRLLRHPDGSRASTVRRSPCDGNARPAPTFCGGDANSPARGCWEPAGENRLSTGRRCGLRRARLEPTTAAVPEHHRSRGAVVRPAGPRCYGPGLRGTAGHSSLLLPTWSVGPDLPRRPQRGSCERLCSPPSADPA